MVAVLHDSPPAASPLLVGRVEQLGADLRSWLGTADPASVSPVLAHRLVAAFGSLEKLAAAGVVLFAAAMADGAKEPAARDLARSLGISKAEADRTIGASSTLSDLPNTRAELMAGGLSRDQVGIITEAASVAPGSEAKLLANARATDLVGLRREAERVKASVGDEKARRAQVHANRSARSWVRDGVWHFHANGPVVQGARFEAAFHPFRDAAMADAPKDHAREPFGAHAFDGLIDLAEAAAGSDQPTDDTDGTDAADDGDGSADRSVRRRRKRKQRRWQALVRVDASAIRRGHTVEGEVCEVVGVGPIDVAAAIDLLGEATVRMMIKDGKDVLSMATATRQYPKALALAIGEKAGFECSITACPNAGFVELDHDDLFSVTHDSSYTNLAPLCSCCHGLKTHHGHRVHHHHDGRMLLLAPGEPEPP